MLQTSLDELRQITSSAIKSAQVKLGEEKARLIASALEQLKNDAKAGKNYSIAMNLRRGDHYTAEGGTPRSLKPEQLEGVAALVCRDLAVFAPTIEYWSQVKSDQRNEEYVEDGLNVVLHWTDSDDLLTKVEGLGHNDMAQVIKAAILATQAAVTNSAKSILAQLKDNAARQARLGKNWAIVMSMRSGTDFTCPTGKSIMHIEPSWLGSVAKAVYDACAEFKPTLEYWSSHESAYDGSSWKVEGINIVVHW